MNLKTLYLAPTLDCNGRCTYCYIPEESRLSERTADFRGILELFLEEAPGNAQLRFIGGEPMLLPDTVSDLSRIFLAARPEGLVVVNTNGTLINAETLKGFPARTGQAAWIVSLDGPASIHDGRRKLLNGVSAHEAAVAGIRALQEHGQRVLCNMVLDPDSAPGMESLFRFLTWELGMDAVSVSLNSLPKEDFPIEEKMRLLRMAYRLGSMHGLSVSGHHRLLLGDSLEQFACRAGKNTVLVGPDSRAYACQRFIGRKEGVPVIPELPLSSLISGNDVNECCYTPESAQLATMLVSFFQDELPEYLRVNDLDRLLFGVL